MTESLQEDLRKSALDAINEANVALGDVEYWYYDPEQQADDWNLASDLYIKALVISMKQYPDDIELKRKLFDTAQRLDKCCYMPDW